jgi:hypothetical protein
VTVASGGGAQKSGTSKVLSRCFFLQTHFSEFSGRDEGLQSDKKATTSSRGLVCEYGQTVCFDFTLTSISSL